MRRRKVSEATAEEGSRCLNSGSGCKEVYFYGSLPGTINWPKFRFGVQKKHISVGNLQPRSIFCMLKMHPIGLCGVFGCC